MQHAPAEQPRGCARYLDPITLNIAVRNAFGSLDAGAALMVFCAALVFSLATGAIWWRYDLMSRSLHSTRFSPP